MKLAVPDTLKFNPKDILVLEQYMTMTRDFDHAFALNDPYSRPIVFERPTEYEIYVRFVVLNPELNIYNELMLLEEFGFYMTHYQISSGRNRIEHEIEFRFYPQHDYRPPEPKELEDYKSIGM